jgi:hypothetical protein
MHADKTLDFVLFTRLYIVYDIALAQHALVYPHVRQLTKTTGLEFERKRQQFVLVGALRMRLDLFRFPENFSFFKSTFNQSKTGVKAHVSLISLNA